MLPGGVSVLRTAATSPGKGGGASGFGGSEQSYSYEGAVGVLAGDAKSSAQGASASGQGGDAETAGGSGVMMALFILVIGAAVVYTQRNLFLSRFPGAASKVSTVVSRVQGGRDKALADASEREGLSQLGCVVDPDEEATEEAAAPVAKPMAAQPKLRKLPESSPASGKKKWKVTVDLGGNPWSVAVAKGTASSVSEVKQLICEACVANIGTGNLPAEWVAGRLDSMEVNFLDKEDELVTLTDSQDLNAVESARSLHVQLAARDQPAAEPEARSTVGSTHQGMDMDD